MIGRMLGGMVGLVSAPGQRKSCWARPPRRDLFGHHRAAAPAWRRGGTGLQAFRDHAAQPAARAVPDGLWV